MESGESRLFLLFPQHQTIFIKIALFIGLLPDSVGIGERLVDKLLALGNHVQQGLVKKPLQNPDQNQEIDDFKCECGDIEFHLCVLLWLFANDIFKQRILEQHDQDNNQAINRQ